jgi:hypothetical protein
MSLFFFAFRFGIIATNEKGLAFVGELEFRLPITEA